MDTVTELSCSDWTPRTVANLKHTRSQSLQVRIMASPQPTCAAGCALQSRSLTLTPINQILLFPLPSAIVVWNPDSVAQGGASQGQDRPGDSRWELFILIGGNFAAANLNLEMVSASENFQVEIRNWAICRIVILCNNQQLWKFNLEIPSQEVLCQVLIRSCWAIQCGCYCLSSPRVLLVLMQT
jgi:hypothetical protein